MPAHLLPSLSAPVSATCVPPWWCLVYSLAGTGSPQEAMAQANLQMVQQRLEMLTASKYCYATVLSDPDLVADCLAYYK